MTVREFLSKVRQTEEYLVVREEDPIETLLAALLARKGTKAILVEDGRGKVTGIVTQGLVARHYFAMGVYRKQGGFLPGGSILDRLTASRAGDIMERSFVSCTMEENLEEVGHKIARHHGMMMVPVLDETGRLAGVLDMIDVIEHQSEKDKQKISYEKC